MRRGSQGLYMEEKDVRFSQQSKRGDSQLTNRKSMPALPSTSNDLNLTSVLSSQRDTVEEFSL